MKKKFLIIILAIMLILSGCGQNGADTSNQVTETLAGKGTEEAVRIETMPTEEAEEIATTEMAETSSEIVEETIAEAQASVKDEKEAAQQPSVTVTPETTQKLSATEKPEETKESAGAEKPAATVAPTATEAPQTSTQTNTDNTGNQNAGSGTTSTPASVFHNYVTETTAATCTSGGTTKTYCSICGDVQSESSTGGGLGHDYQKSYWPSAPTCTCHGTYTLICTRCGESGGSGTDPALPHTPVTREETGSHAVYCNEHGVLVTECSVCGAELSREGYSGTDHEWVTGTSQPIWDDAAGDFVIYEVTYCSRCNKLQ